MEVLVLLADVNADLGAVDRPRLTAVLRSAPARCFDEPLDADAVERVVDAVIAASRGTTV